MYLCIYAVLIYCYGCYLALSYSLGSIALVYCTSIATISRRGVKEKLFFPEDYLPDGEMRFSEPLVDLYEQYWSPGLWRISFPPLPCTANRRGLTHHDSEVQRMRIFSFILWYPGRGRTTYAPVLLISVYEGFGEPHLPVR